LRHVTIAKADVITEPTAKQIEANNKAMVAMGCKYVKPKKGPAVS
jgi:hypothetical protein